VDHLSVGPRPSRRRERKRRAWARISPGELSCRVAEEGLLLVARRLATTPAVVRAAMNGAMRLSPVRVVALREGMDLEPFFDAWFESRRGGPAHG